MYTVGIKKEAYNIVSQTAKELLCDNKTSY